MNEHFLSQLVFWHWFALALVLGIVDILVGANFLLVWCGLAAGIVGLIILIVPKITWEYQFLLFGIGVLASFLFWRYSSKRLFGTVKSNTLNQRGRQYIGRQFTLTEPVVNGMGRLHVDDTIWRVEGDDMPTGTTVEVVDVDGTLLMIKKVESK